MKRSSDLKLIDLLSLRPGCLLHVHAVKGEAGCREVESISKSDGWRIDISHAVLPGGDSREIDNLSKLLDIPIDTQVLIRHPDGKVIEILRLDRHSWHDLLTRDGHRADVMVNGRVIAEGEVVNSASQSGILIKKLASM